MKKIIVTAAISASVFASSVSADVSRHEIWKTIMDTTPRVNGNWEQQCQGLARKVMDVRMFKGAGYNEDDIFNMMYEFTPHPDDDFGVSTLIVLGFHPDLSVLSDQELARYVYNDCMEARW